MTDQCPWTYRTVAAADGDLPANEQTEVEAHIESCAICTALIADLANDLAMARQLSLQGENTPVPVAVLLGSARRTTLRRRSTRYAVAAAVTLIAFGAAFVRASERRADSDDARQWSSDVAALERRIDELEAELDVWRQHSLADDFAVESGDPAWLQDAQTAAVILRSAELLESELGMHDAAQSRYRNAYENFGNTNAGRAAGLRIDTLTQVN